ncbi:MAG: hypothetical protein RLZZ501_172, partial [Pseudomonadota bacterium]
MGISRRAAIAGLATLAAGCVQSPRRPAGSGPVASGPAGVNTPALPPLAPLPLARRQAAVAGPVDDPAAVGLDAVV